jgi:hypothetical protein
MLLILVPSLSRGRELARQTSCASNLRGVAWAIPAYINMYNYWPTNEPTEKMYKITWNLAEYVPPANPLDPDVNVNALYNCPSAKKHGPNGDYAFVSHRLTDSPEWPNASKYNARPIMGYKFHRKPNAAIIKRPLSEIVIGGDGAQPPKDMGWHFSEIHYTETFAVNGNHSASIVPRHITHTVLLYADSHVQAARWDDFTSKIDLDGVTVFRCTAMMDPR